MRKEDKVKLPPKLKLKLPPGYYLERCRDGYYLYQAVPVKMAWGQGTVHRLTSAFGKEAPGLPDRICRDAWAQVGVQWHACGCLVSMGGEPLKRCAFQYCSVWDDQEEP